MNEKSVMDLSSTAADLFRNQRVPTPDQLAMNPLTQAVAADRAVSRQGANVRVPSHVMAQYSLPPKL